MNNDKILDRVRKMLAMANDERGNQHEREQALRMAHNLLIKHGLDLLDVERSQRDAEDARGRYTGEGHSMRWALHIRLHVARLFMCRYLVGAKLNSWKCEHVFIGRESNATTAMYISDYVVNSIVKESRKRFGGDSVPEARSFALGCADQIAIRVREMLADKDDQFSAPDKALIVVAMRKEEDDANEVWIRANVQTKALRRASSKVKADSYAEGREYGKGIGLSPQVAKPESQMSLEHKR